MSHLQRSEVEIITHFTGTYVPAWIISRFQRFGAKSYIINFFFFHNSFFRRFCLVNKNFVRIFAN